MCDGMCVAWRCVRSVRGGECRCQRGGVTVCVRRGDSVCGGGEMRRKAVSMR